MRNVLAAVFSFLVVVGVAGPARAATAGQNTTADDGHMRQQDENGNPSRFTPRCEAVGSKNLVRNSSFECGSEFWSSLGKPTGWGGDLSGLYGVVESGNAADGKSCLRIDMGPGVTPVTYFDVWPPVHEVQHAPIAANIGWMSVRQGEPITLSAYLKSSVVGTKARFLFRFAGNALNPIQEAAHEVTLCTEWTRYTVTQSALNDDVCIAVGPDMTSMPDTPASFWIDAIQLETGSEPTAFETREPLEIGIVTGRYGNVYDLSDPILLSVSGDNRSGSDATVSLKLEMEDYYGTALPSVVLPVEIPANGRVAIPWSISVPGKGYYRAKIAWTVEGRDHTRTFAFTVIEPYSHEDSPFGLNHPATTDRQLKLLSKAGIRWVRNWGINWEWVEPTRGQISWKEQDEQMQYLSAAGMNTLVVFPNPSTNWTSTAPSSVKDTLWYRMAYAPSEPALLFRFIENAVGRYRTSSRYWEFLNEPLWVPDFCLPQSAGYKIADYIELLKGAYAAIKVVDPDLKVIAGLASEPKDLMGDEFIAEGGLDYCDIFNLHPYGRLIIPEDFVGRMERILKAMDASGKRKPIWATETSYYAVDDKPWSPWIVPPDHFSAGLLWPNERIAADNIIRHALIMLAHGVVKIFYHEPIEGPVNNGTMDIENTFLSPDAVPRKSYAAISALSNLLGPSPEYSGQLKTPETTNAYGYAFQCNGRAVLAAWAPRDNGEPKICWIDVPTEVKALDIMGNHMNTGKITLSGSPVYLESDALSPEALLAACPIKSDARQDF